MDESDLEIRETGVFEIVKSDKDRTKHGGTVDDGGVRAIVLFTRDHDRAFRDGQIGEDESSTAGTTDSRVIETSGACGRGAFNAVEDEVLIRIESGVRDDVAEVGPTVRRTNIRGVEISTAERVDDVVGITWEVDGTTAIGIPESATKVEEE